LVVDNNSSDGTRDTVLRYVASNPQRFRYAFAATQGKSHALNTGVRLAEGEILAFTDDDVSIDSCWLARLVSVFDDPKVCGVGGRILPDWNSEPPVWLPSEAGLVSGPLVVFDLGTECIPIAEAPFGANMAFRKAAFQRWGEFRTDLGPRPGSEIRGEDSEFCDRLIRNGETIYYQPTALVYHAIPPERLSKKYFVRWWFDKGRSEVRAQDSALTPVARLKAVFRLVISATKWSVASLTSSQPRKRFERRLIVATKLGAIAELTSI
jgi:glycosyltransferase involved in cell wall biosynthesis